MYKRRQIRMEALGSILVFQLVIIYIIIPVKKYQKFMTSQYNAYIYIVTMANLLLLFSHL